MKVFPQSVFNLFRSIDTGNIVETVVGPTAFSGPGANDEDAAPGAGEDPRVRAADEEPASDGLPEISTNGCRVRELIAAPLVGDTSDTLRFFAALKSVNNWTSPARTSSSNPQFQRTTLERFAASIETNRPIKR